MEIAVQTRGSWDLILTTAQRAESLGVPAFALPDHYLDRGDSPHRPAFDHLVHLAALARETSKIQLVALLSPVTFRHPAVYYKMGVTLDEISGGRFTLGVGTGWMDQEFELFGIDYPDRATRFELLEECLAYLSAAISPGAQGFEGKHYRLAEFDPHPHPTNLRLLVGGGGKTKTPRLAGRYADEFNIYARPPDELAQRLGTARDEAAKAGRGPDSLFFSTAFPAVAARGAGDYRKVLDLLAERTSSTPERIEQVYRERHYPHGHGSQPMEMLAALEAAGCRRAYLQVFYDDPTVFETVLDAFTG